jgi:hypothetical protein
MSNVVNNAILHHITPMTKEISKLWKMAAVKDADPEVEGILWELSSLFNELEEVLKDLTSYD